MLLSRCASDELGLLPVIDAAAAADGGASAFFVLHEHKLGVAFAAVARIYAHAQKAYLQCRRELGINAADAASPSHRVEIDAPMARRVLDATRAMLLINDDCYTALHLRCAC